MLNRRKFLKYISKGISLVLLTSNCSKKNITGADEINSNSIVLTNGIIIDGNGSQPVHGASIVIEDNIISKIGNLSDSDLKTNTQIYDLKNSIILPGFINSHVHTLYDTYKLNRWAVEGVTTVRDLGIRPYSQSLFNIKKSNNGKEQYSRLVAVGPFFTCANGYPVIPFGGPPGYIVNSPEDARNKTAAIINEGADVIKIGLESGKTWDINIPVMSDQEAKAIISEAHKHNIPVSAHILSVNDLEHAVNLGVDEIAHMASDESIPDALIQEMINKNIYLVPTLELWLGVSKNRSSMAINNLNKFVEAGGKVALGTDYMGYTIEWELGMPKKEILAMRDAGMSPMQIITAATKNAAHVCNLEDEIGTISEGKIADIIVLERNPLENISNVFQPLMVIHYGKIVVNKMGA